ncbi:hypothetical protein HNP65_000090 [Thermosipho japonicus]|uniref:Mutator family transposase n=1 Tax=Thermosipho japonicus TaxID=90323 RepID=A0A841GQL8_9BACT|nr:hypothetical protein [Thermosipho japonicus]MBB6061668.1 hypothetical protein [Thermosipho japonicus]
MKLVKEKNEVMGRRYEEKEESYLAFLGYSVEIRKHIYTTNPVESVKTGLEGIRKDWVDTFQFSNLNDVWMRKPIPTVRGNLYRLRQIMRMKFGFEEMI